ncbi:MAG: hypothetical protein HY873_12275 [Chloroflexi bacterium]|nr:hypothetical protein [Chloroflexota bacterium]
MAPTRTNGIVRIALGLSLLATGAGLFLAQPGIALAHHTQVATAGDCAAWTTEGEYIGGSEDRKVVVDVTINGEHILQTFYFDFGPGHLGHQSYWLLYERSGSGSLVATGTIVMYRRSGAGTYTVIDDSDVVTVNMLCATATPTATATFTSTHTATAVPTDTPTSTPTNTPPATETSTAEPTNTPAPSSTNTPAATNTPAVTSTSTATSSPTTTVVTEGLVTPLPPTRTPAGATPTFVSTVEALLPPGQPHGPDRPSTGNVPPRETASGLPNAGAFAGSGRDAMVRGILGMALAAAGLAGVASGLRRQRV